MSKFVMIIFGASDLPFAQLILTSHNVKDTSFLQLKPA